MAEKPRLLVIEREGEPGEDHSAQERLSGLYEVTVARSMARAFALLRDQSFAGVYLDSSQLPALHWAGILLQADEILDAIADGVAVVDTHGRILWANPEFRELAGLDEARAGSGLVFDEALGHPERVAGEDDPFATALASNGPVEGVLKLASSRFVGLTVTPMRHASGRDPHLIALTRDVTTPYLQKQKIDTIHRAGEELAELTREELAQLGPRERVELLKYNIARHMKDLLGLDFIEVRILEPATGRLSPLLTEGMTPLAAHRELFAREENNGVTGYVAATGKSYLCDDTTRDPRYLEGAAGARSSLTVPLMHHGAVIGTLNVENPQPHAFREQDRQFLEIYAQNIASALNTLDLLNAEKESTASASVEAISRALALPVDEILNDATIVLDRYAGHDEDIIHRLRHLIFRAREIRGLIQQVGSSLVPEMQPQAAPPAPRLAGARLLVVDADESIRRAAHHLLGRQGAIVETAQSGHEATALARQTPYSAALVDIRLPDLDGYETFLKLREVQPGLPIVLMTGFGYDARHCIVKARREGLRFVVTTPFRTNLLMEAVEQSIRPVSPPPTPSSADPA
ncbi:MAG: GAF domain-containing protein [Isosphaeraceae bacterium]